MLRIQILLIGAFCMTALICGCGQMPNQNAESKAKTRTADAGHKEADGHDHKSAATSTGQDHSGWWCNEHGVPEEICGRCNSKVAAELQKKGDWCKEHDRPDSQCFKCHPELEAKFAAQFEAKFGTQPPKPDVN